MSTVSLFSLLSHSLFSLPSLSVLLSFLPLVSLVSHVFCLLSLSFFISVCLFNVSRALFLHALCLWHTPCVLLSRPCVEDTHGPWWKDRHISTRLLVCMSPWKAAQTAGINKKSKTTPHSTLSVLPHTSLTTLLLTRSLVVNSSFPENGLPTRSNRFPTSPKDFLHFEVGQRRTTHTHTRTHTHLHKGICTYADTCTRMNHKQGRRQGFHFVRKHKTRFIHVNVTQQFTHSSCKTYALYW